MDSEISPAGTGRASGRGTCGGAVTLSGGPGAIGSVTDGSGGSGIVPGGGVGSAATGWGGGTGSPGIIICRGDSAACAAPSGGAGATTDEGMKAAVEASCAVSVTAGSTGSWEAVGLFRRVEAATTMPAPITSNRLFFKRRLAGPGWGSPGASDSTPSTPAGESKAKGGGLSRVKSSPQASQVTASPVMETGT